MISAPHQGIGVQMAQFRAGLQFSFRKAMVFDPECFVFQWFWVPEGCSGAKSVPGKVLWDLAFP